MSAPEKCPKCCEEVIRQGHRFRLSGERSEERCLRNQRDHLATEVDALRTANAALLERVKRLEDVGDRMAGSLNAEVSPHWEDGLARRWRIAKGQP